MRITDVKHNIRDVIYAANDHFHGRLPENTSQSKSRVMKTSHLWKGAVGIAKRMLVCYATKIKAHMKIPQNKWLIFTKRPEDGRRLKNKISGSNNRLWLTVKDGLRSHDL